MPLTNGLVMRTPTSIVAEGSGQTATINPDGSVSYAGCSVISLNGVFTSTYDNYVIAMRFIGTSASQNLTARLRLSGTDSTAANYTRQVLYAQSTSATAVRHTGYTGFYIGLSDTSYSGFSAYLFGPALAQPTAARGSTASGSGGAYIWEEACTHSLSTAYDGITFFASAGNLSGLISVFGFNQ
jgi:hypothetical protein